MVKTQEKIEQKFFECVWDIAEELKLDIPFLPEVYWIDRKFQFETLGLPKKERKEYEFVKKDRQSVFFHNQAIVLIGSKNIMNFSEEAGHFLHFANSNLKLYNKSKKDYFASWIIVEMLGFFSSKLIEPSRKNLLTDYPDILGDKEKCLRAIEKNGWEIEDFLIYQQGYGLGEKLFNSYLYGLKKKKDISNLFKDKLEGRGKAYSTFLNLKTSLN